MGKHHKEPIQAIMTEDGEVTGDQQIAEVFNNFCEQSASCCQFLRYLAIC